MCVFYQFFNEPREYYQQIGIIPSRQQIQNVCVNRFGDAAM